MQENTSESKFDGALSISSSVSGCTLGGALSVSSFIPNAVTVIHAPSGCAHQTFSMLHAMMNDSGICAVPQIVVSNISDREVIFGGERALCAALDTAAAKNPDLIVMVTSCVPETIGDDCATVCANHFASEKIIYIPTSGFLGGSSMGGENAVLKGIAEIAAPAPVKTGTVCLIGEKNLETEAEENYAEIVRLLSLLKLSVIVRFCRNEPVSALKTIGAAECFIARDERVIPAAEFISKKFGRPLVRDFPRGLGGCMKFLKEVGAACGLDAETIATALDAERDYQKAALLPFVPLAGKRIFLGAEPFAGTFAVAREAMQILGIAESDSGILVKLPFYLPVGCAGTVKMLNLWKREVLYG
ncbi:MAG TPA: oxidoreductase [Methanocorpusculum sp.]|nr:oxidoreductase [Methanocorpusculum sp.]